MAMTPERARQILAWYGERGFIDPATLKPMEKFFIAHENEANAEVREALLLGATALRSADRLAAIKENRMTASPNPTLAEQIRYQERIVHTPENPWPGAVLRSLRRCEKLEAVCRDILADPDIASESCRRFWKVDLKAALDQESDRG